MAKSTFSNADLVSVWREVSSNNGTRREVVVALMKRIGLDPKDAAEYKKMYNNVTQRKKSLEKRSEGTATPIQFAELKPGARGNKADADEIAKLAALMAGADEGEAEAETEGETAETVETEEVATE
jgi:hypothetical protein